MSYKERAIQASHEVEALAIIAKQIVADLREGKPNPYGRVYWLRKELGKVVSELGSGTPRGLHAIEREYGEQLASELKSEK